MAVWRIAKIFRIMSKKDYVELRRAYRRLLCATDTPYSDYAKMVLADLLEECEVFSVGYQINAVQTTDNAFVAGKRYIGVMILEKLGITNLRKITNALQSVPPEDVEVQEVAENKEEGN